MSHNQFGYKQHDGCESAIFIVNEVVDYFKQRYNSVYIITLDASAAFGRVNIYGVLSKLIRLYVNDIIRLMLN
jgi:hypothetical protein